jgi:GTP-binding protein Era
MKNPRCGIVSIVGRPNVGKSTLLNRILEEKVAIVSNVPQTTRTQIRGIYNDERGQIVFIDTPGLRLGKDKMDQFLIKASFGTLRDVDCVIHLTDVTEPTGEEEEEVVSRLRTLNVPVILGLNKVDLKPKYVHEYIGLWEKSKGVPVTEMKNFTILPLSGKDGTNIDKLLDILFSYLPTGPALYPQDTIADIPQKITISDIIREKLFHVMREEIPHSLAVVVEDILPRRRKVLHISAVILVERESQKEIVIGKKGNILKKVGTLAREELEDILERKIFLDLFVKTQKKWRNDVSLLQEMGYDPDAG